MPAISPTTPGPSRCHRLRAPRGASAWALVLALVLGLPLSRASAASAQTLRDALADVLAVPEVRLGSTTPLSPLLTAGNHLEALWGSTRATVDEVCAQIAAAQHEVLLQTFELNDEDEAAVALYAALQARMQAALSGPARPAGSELRIRILVNGTWPALNRTSQQRLLELVGALGDDARLPGRLAVEVAQYTGFGLSVLHTKTLVVDGARALVMTGNFKTLRGLDDDMVNMATQVRGPVAQTLRDDWLDARRRSTPLVALGDVDALDAAAPEPKGAAAPGGGVAGGPPAEMAVLARTSRWAPWRDRAPNPQNAGLLALLGASTERIEAINPALNVPAVLDALARAVLERGVRVELVLSLNLDRWRQRHLLGGDNADAAYLLYARLLAEGGEAAADLLHVCWPSVDGVAPAPDGSGANVHTKAVAIDGTCLFLGSMNWDHLSWNTSRELSLAIFGAQEHEAMWRADIWGPVHAASVAIRASELPAAGRRAGDPVAAYLRRRRRGAAGPAVARRGLPPAPTAWAAPGP